MTIDQPDPAPGTAFHYFVAYWGSHSGGEFRVGRTNIVLDHPIRSIEDIAEIEQALRGLGYATPPVVTGWQRWESQEPT